MDYSNKLLGKSIEELTYDDIENYFNSPKEETDLIEYKSYDSREGEKDQYRNIFKAICALLNSQGGIVIWGSPKGQKISGKKEKQFVGPLSPIEFVIEKDAFVNRISDNITPIPSGIKVEIREASSARIVIIEIQKSEYPPHQTNNTYFMRLDGQSRPAPHHYIEALFKQIRYPKLGGYLKIISTYTRNSPVHHQDYELDINVAIFNHSPLQNDESVLFRLYSSVGKFEINNSSFISQDINILHYGTPLISRFKIFYSQTELNNASYKDRLILLFGGKKSPMKKSEYTIEIPVMKPTKDQIKNMVLNFIENKSLSDIAEGKGTEEDKVSLWKNS